MRIPGRALPAAASLVSRAAVNTPTVDLGYEAHTSTYNATGDYYAFTNIRYADPPERFSEAVAPTTTTGTVINDTSTRFCPQAYPWWLVLEVAAEYGLGDAPGYFEDNYLYATEGDEDCLFLDVYSPSSIFNGSSSNSDGAAVLVWIHGGGYTTGSKADSDWNPAGLIHESEVEDQEGIVFVKLNYRLGMFGWMGTGDGVIPNLGALDQRLALQWVQKYIHLFGGDPNRVTVMGESAGAGSIMLQMTAFEGSQGSAPFQQAIVQSPGFESCPNASIGWDHALEAATNLTGSAVTTLEQLRALDAATAIEVNKDAVNVSTHGLWTYGPASGSDFTPDMPAFLLAEGKFDSSVTVMVGHNIDEAEEFAPNDAYSNADVKEWAYKLLTNVSDTAIDDILTNVYPDDLSGDYGYTTEADRLELMMADSGFTCNTRYLAKAYVGANQDFFGYEFAYAPGVHGQDTSFTFYNGDETDTSVAGTIVSPALATTMQKYFTRFAQTGDPNGLADLVEWPQYASGDAGIENTLLRFNTAIDTIEDPTANSRCEYWQSGAWRE